MKGCPQDTKWFSHLHRPTYFHIRDLQNIIMPSNIILTNYCPKNNGHNEDNFSVSDNYASPPCEKRIETMVHHLLAFTNTVHGSVNLNIFIIRNFKTRS